jgi:hypothetical protein
MNKSAITTMLGIAALTLIKNKFGSSFKLPFDENGGIHPAVELAKHLDKVFQSRIDSGELPSDFGMRGLNDSHPMMLNFAGDVRMEYMQDPSILPKLVNPFDWEMPRLEYGRYFFRHIPSGIVFVVSSKARPSSNSIYEPIVYARMKEEQKKDYAEPGVLADYDGYQVFAFKNPITLFGELNRERQHDVWFRTNSKYDEDIIGIENYTPDRFPPKGDIKIISYNEMPYIEMRP